MYFQLKFQPYEKFVQRCIQLRTVLNNIQEPISSCLTSSSPSKQLLILQGLLGQFGLRGWEETGVCQDGLLQRPENGSQADQH